MQYIISGHERIGSKTFTDQALIEQDQSKDYAFYQSEVDVFNVNEGMFAIFFSDDLHMPGISCEEPTFARKVVVKILK